MDIDINQVKQIIDNYEARRDFLIEILQDVQDIYHYLPQGILEEVSRFLDIPLNKIYEVATYYKAFSLKPQGRFKVSICQGTACHVQGADVLRKTFERELETKLGETDKNRDFTLESVRCIGCCGLAPVVTINQDVHPKLEPSRIQKIIESYRSKPKRETGE